MSTLHIAVLGPPDIRHGERVLSFPTRKALALLIYLAVEGGIHTRKRLSEIFWPELDAEHGRAALRATLQQLRSGLIEEEGLGPQCHLRIERDTVSVDLSDITLDIHALHDAWQLLQNSGASSATDLLSSLQDMLSAVTRLVRGEFLAGFTLRDVLVFDDWTRYYRDTTHRQLQHVYERLTILLMEGGELEHALDIATRWLAFDPLDESGYQHLMRLHIAQGDRAAALRVYRACCDILSAELHLEPTPQTVALAEQVRTAVPVTRREHQWTEGVSLSATASIEVPLVGRGNEFRILIERYQQARRGHSQGVFIEGISGIGKTRLATDLLSWARSQGAVVWQGHCYATRYVLPYQLLVDMLRPPLDQESDLMSLMTTSGLTELSRLFPELRERYPHLLMPISDEGASSRLFETVAILMQALAHDKPVVLFLDDLQWADSATLDLLLYLFRSWVERERPVLLLCVVSNSQENRTPLAPWQIAMQRSGLVTRLSLRPITQQDTLHLLTYLQQAGRIRENEQDGEQALNRVSQWLYRETEGHPFYLLETLRALLDRQVLTSYIGANGRCVVDFTAVLENEGAMRRVIPDTVSEIITARLRQLAPAAQLFLVAGAVLKTNLRFEQMCRVAQIDEEQGLAALDEVIRAGLLREERAPRDEQESRYYFTHDITRDVVYGTSTSARQRVFHRRALEILRAGDASAAELARHALACGQLGVAFVYLITAGDEAMELFAVQDAVVLYERAHALLDAEPTVLHEQDEARVQHLYLHLGRAYEVLEQWEQALHTYDAMLTTARLSQSTPMVCEALNHLAFLSTLHTLDIEKALLLLDEAHHLAVTSQDQRTEAEVAWNRAQILLHAWHLQEAQSHALHALRLARSLAIPELVARCLYVLTLATLWEGAYTQTIAYATEAIALYSALETQPSVNTFLPLYLSLSGASPSFQQTNQAARIGCIILRLNGYLGVGHVRAALKDGRDAVALSVGTKNAILHAWSLQNLNHVLLEIGHYEEALHVALQARSLVSSSTNIVLRYYVLAVLGFSYQALFLLEKAQATLEEAIALVKTTSAAEQQLLILPWLCVNQGLAGAWDAAAISAKEILRLRQRTEVNLIVKDFTSPYEARALLYAGEQAVAREYVQQLGERIGTNRRHRIHYLRSLALLAHEDGKPAQAISSLRDAAQLADELGLPGEQWQIQSVLRDLYRSIGQEELAHGALLRASAIIHELAEQIQDETLRISFLQAAAVRRALEWKPVLYHPGFEEHALLEKQA